MRAPNAVERDTARTGSTYQLNPLTKSELIGFEKIAACVVESRVTDFQSVKVFFTELQFYCLELSREKKMIAEIGVKAHGGDRPGRAQNLAIRRSWQALEDYYNGDDIVLPNIFDDSCLSAAEECVFHKELALIRLEGVSEGSVAEFLGWSKAEVHV